LAGAGAVTETASVDFAAMMALEPHGPDTYVAQGPSYPWGGLYGGQIVAQALRAAAATVEARFAAHSLHAYFIRRGDASEPIRFEVDRLRNGRSFVTRAVVARQSTGAILSMAASFQIEEGGPDIQTARPPDRLAGPDAVVPDAWSPMFDRRAHTDRPPGRASAWLRIADPIADDPVLHACALAYLSDDMPTDAVSSLHPDGGRWGDAGWQSASLDHAIWFHRPARADGWQLHEFAAERYQGARGVSVGHVFVGPDHVATVAQEVLLRHRRDV
jgi:acyl-CoA thioesterase-2